jgi:multidrug efflux pump
MFYIAFTSDRHSPLEITDYADRYVKDRLQNLSGVAEVRIYGERRAAMRIWVDPARLAAYDLTVQDIENALRAQNVEIPAGRIESVDREFTVLSQTGLTEPQEFENIVIKDVDGFPVRVEDVAQVEIGPADERRTTRYNGENAVILAIVKQATANPLEVAQGARAALPGIIDELPAGMNAAVANDTSVFIEESIHEVFVTVAEAVILVILIIYFFLRTWRATLIPLVTIPVSLVGTFVLMYALGFSVNTLTLLAMVLAIGLVVDDAIVVLENIHRHMERGVPRVAAAIQGIKEISGAVIAMTLTLAAVYTPIAFSEGLTGRLFTEFALTLAGAVLVSGFVALTLTPMMCSKLLRHRGSHGRLYNWLERGFDAANRGYRVLLQATLKARPLVVLGGLGVAGASYFLFTSLDSELAPAEDRGTVQIVGRAPVGSTPEYTARWAQRIEPLVEAIPELQGAFVLAGFPDTVDILSLGRLEHWDQRSRSQQEIAAELIPKLARIPGIQVYVSNPPSLGQSGRSQPIEFIVQTSSSYEELATMVDKLLRKARNYPGFQNLDTDLRLDKPQLDIEVDRAKVADTGVGVEILGRTLESLLGGRQVTRFNRNAEQYDVIVQVADSDRATPEDLRRLYVRGDGGAMVQLSNLIRVHETVAPTELNRFNQLRSASISASLAPGYSLGEGLAAMERIAARTLPADFQTDYSGQSREFKESSTSIYITFVLALLFIYLVLSAQFESFVDPLIIMLTVPLAITGALLALNLTGGTLNIYSQIGLITLIGLITKHGILIVEFANQLQARGRAVREAVVEAAALRLRPILMTTGAMVFGALPLALATGAGAESRQQIGWVIVGGVTFGTILTLFVVPTAYTLLARTRGRQSAWSDSPERAVIAEAGLPN